MIWQRLNTPERFDMDWYGELTNQAGHTLLGALAAVLICVGWRVYAGEMPYVATVLALVLVPYLIVEIFVQGWAAGDTWFDSVMVALGASVIVPFEEVAVDGHLTMLAFDHRALIALLAVWATFILLRVGRRVVAQQRHN